MSDVSRAGPDQWHVVRLDVEAGVATITLDRPDRGNSWTGRMEVEYRQAVARAEGDPSVGAIVITGAGRRFCVGADRRALSAMGERGEYDRGVREPLAEPGAPDHPAHGTRHGFLLSLTKPVIAAVNGSAAGVGFVLACFCDVRFVASDAKLTTSTSRLGMPAELGVSWILPRLVGPARAAHLLLGSPVITGEEAAAIGLAHQALPAGEVLAAAQAYARTLLAEVAPSSLALVKRQLWTDLDGTLRDADERAATLLDESAGHPDFREGVAAAAEGRPPRFGARYAQPSD